MSARISVELVGDSRSLERAFARSSKSATRFTRELTGLGGRTRGVFRGLAAQAGVAFGAAGLIAGIKSTIEAASDLNEQVAKTQVVFGDSAGEIEAWSETTAKSFGIARREALGTASSFGALFRPLGLGSKEAAEQSRRLTELGSDLASFYNTDVQDALDAIQSGIVGQSRPLRRYGVLLSATRVNLEAMRETGKKSATQLTDQEKVLARINIIYHDTALAQGDFARTSDHLANQQRILSAQVDNLKERLGTALLPIVTNIVIQLNKWLSSTENQQRLTSFLTGVVQGFANTVQTTGRVVGGLISMLGGLKNTITVLVGAWVGFRAAGVASAIAVTAANLVASRAVATAWRAALISTGWGVFAVAAGIAAAYVVTHWQKVKIWFSDFFLWLAENADKAALKVVEPFTHVPTRLGKPFRKAKEFIKADLAEITKEATANAQKLDELARPAPSKAPRLPTIPPLPKLPKIPKIPSAPAAPAATKPAGRGGARQSAMDRMIEILQLDVDRAGLTKKLSDDLAALEALKRYLQQRLRLNTHSLDLQRQLLGVQQQILGVQQQITDNQRQQAEQRKQQALQLAQAKEAARTAAQFRALGFDPSGGELVPSAKALRKRLGSLADAVSGTFLDTSKTQALLNRIRKVLSGSLGKLGKDVRERIKQLLDDLGSQLADLGDGTTRAAAAAAPRYGTTLTLAGAGPVTAGMTINGGLNLYGVQDVKQLEEQLLVRANQRPHPRRGP